MTYQRRNLIVATGVLLALPSIAFTQANKNFRVGVLSFDDNPRDPIWVAFIMEMAALGYVEGRNLTVVPGFAGKNGRSIESAAVELVGLNIDVLYVAAGTSGVQAAKSATSTIPIVMLTAGEPVRDNLIASLSHPGGNITGNANFGLDLLIKRLQIIVEILGSPRHVAFLTLRPSPFTRHIEAYRDTLSAAAQTFGVEPHFFVVDSIDDLEAAFSDMTRRRMDALVIDSTSTFYVHVKRVGALVVQHRLPAIGDGRRYADAGLLVAYGIDYNDLARKSARYVDRILRGAKPSNLPVERATKFEMVVNLKAAEDFGLKIPRGMLAGASEVIR
ncbi:ABC transporter substrate-binding protein [Variovorax sp. J2P1-59]|uniref:ABC transporter substrate-binding protein n=1 Tax=Variovorax flavidus TaxID=3053501 RepID=UPI002574E928|nr:ABC transporter substrate-binding protein [Variovorax sp. J2P1-59]MDM0075535.1 ABC transporter substrate-binding protein [Variovorax sp. J2P1-59]